MLQVEECDLVVYYSNCTVDHSVIFELSFSPQPYSTEPNFKLIIPVQPQALADSLASHPVSTSFCSTNSLSFVDPLVLLVSIDLKLGLPTRAFTKAYNH